MTIAASVGNSILRIGSQGDAVRAVQLALAKLGYPLKGTGYFGGATDTAVTDFQKRQALTVDGEVGRATALALDNAASAKGQGISVVPAESERPLWLTYGLTLIGTKELLGPKDNPVIIQWAKDEGGDIAEDYTHDSIPWCSLGINHIITKVGLKGTETLWALDWNADAMHRRVGRRWPSVELTGPAVGAIVPMLRSGGGHVMCVVGRDQDGRVMGLGFNQSDAVNIAPFATSRLNKGFWWPADTARPANVGIKSLPLVRSDGRLSSNEA